MNETVSERPDHEARLRQIAANCEDKDWFRAARFITEAADELATLRARVLELENQTPEDREVEIRNDAVSAFCTKLLALLGGSPHAGTFGGADCEAVARGIVALKKKIDVAETMLTALTGKP